MREGEASRTAEGAAAARAIHTLLLKDPIFKDEYALQLTSARWRWVCKTPIVRGIVNQIFLKPLRSIQAQVVVRSRYCEDLLEVAMDAGITQYVIVGAGFDSFSLRRRDLARTLAVFELDHQDTQHQKLERLKVLGESIPENLQCVAVDFEQETVADALIKSDYQRGQRGFYSWLGTTPYLSNEATLATLRAIASTAAVGSEIVFDYLISAALVPESGRETMRKLHQFTERRGEPLVGEFNPFEMEVLLNSVGFEMLENLSPDEQTERYLADRADGLTPLAAGYLVHARVGVK